MHNHTKPTPCNHKFKFCIECDVVYCEECREEWHKGTVNAPWFSVGDPLPMTYTETYSGTTGTGCMWDDVPEGESRMMVCPCSKCNNITM